MVTGVEAQAWSRSLIRSIGPTREISSANSEGTAATASSRRPARNRSCTVRAACSYPIRAISSVW